MLFITQTYPADVVENITDRLDCIDMIQRGWRLTYEEAEIVYDILLVNNLLIIPKNRHQIVFEENSHFYVGVCAIDTEEVKKELLEYRETFYVLVGVDMVGFSNCRTLIKFVRIEDSSIMYIDNAYLRPTLITNILKDL